MAVFSRRGALFGAAACAVSGSAWASPTSIANDPGFRAFTRPTGVGALPLQEAVETDQGALRLGEWIGRRPTVLALWASWCTPCLLEKPHQAALAQRLMSAHASARVMALQICDNDNVELSDARWMLDRLGANALPLAKASARAQTAFERALAVTPRDQSRMTLPVVLLIGGDGLELGRAVGAMHGADGRSDYWQDEATFSFLSRLI